MSKTISQRPGSPAELHPEIPSPMKSQLKLLWIAGAICFVQPQTGADLQAAAASLQNPTVITIRPDASALESLAANEVRRYVYLRTGKVLSIERKVSHGARIVVACKN
jgi:hypothetical protein